MAKRKRLTPANPAFLEPAPEAGSAPGGPVRAAPIAEVARDVSATAAAEEMARTLAEARESGRMVLPVPLDAIAVDHLVRDRVAVLDEEMQALRDSLRARGQQTPVDLVALGQGRYGLISGWRRCAALKSLHEETGEDRFATVLGLLRQPGEQADAYLAMVEENEIRVGLSYFERARIVVKSVEQGVFTADRAALQTLFQSASRAKRSKIGAFLPIVRGLEGCLRFPEALGERQGVALGRKLAEDPALAERLRAALARAVPESPDAEWAAIDEALAGGDPGAVPTSGEAGRRGPASRPGASPAPPPPAAVPADAPGGPQPRMVVGGVTMQAEEGRILLEGYRVDAAFRDRLFAWLRQTY
jgi:hypothetical protein